MHSDVSRKLRGDSALFNRSPTAQALDFRATLNSRLTRAKPSKN
jgi:hypothetical protein